jgi:hypothetical protein
MNLRVSPPSNDPEGKQDPAQSEYEQRREDVFAIALNLGDEALA